VAALAIIPSNNERLELHHMGLVMTSPPSWYGLAHECQMRAAETRALADDMKEPEPRVIMLRIAADYEKLAEWAEKNSVPWWDKVGQKTCQQVGLISHDAARRIAAEDCGRSHGGLRNGPEHRKQSRILAEAGQRGACNRRANDGRSHQGNNA
jgi:hypothetical protein